MAHTSFRPFLFILVLGLLLSCEKDDTLNLPPDLSWLEILEQQDDYDLFVQALQSTGLSDELGGTAYTVFVVKDTVFQNYLNAIGTPDIDSWIGLLGNDLARLILSYHIIHGPGIDTSLFTTSFISSNAINAYGNPISLHISCDGPLISINSYASLIGTPVLGGKLAIHEIDRVLYLPTVVDIVAHDAKFSLLRQSLQKAGNSLDALLRQENEKFCFFAPTNRGFQDFIADNNNFSDFKGFTDYYSNTEVRDILLYHMLPQVLRSEDFKNGPYSTRLSGQSLTLVKDLDGSTGILDAYGNQAGVMLTDIHALNGVVHSINYVLRPL